MDYILYKAVKNNQGAACFNILMCSYKNEDLNFCKTTSYFKTKRVYSKGMFL